MAFEALDRPVWNMLTGRQAHLAEGDARAVRIDRGYGVFGAAADPGIDAQAGLAALVPDDGELWIVEGEPWPVPPGVREVKRAVLTQMVAEGVPSEPGPGAPRIIALGEEDAPEMAALAEHAKPGPWGPKTHRYGPFFGIRENGRLLAMAGQRMLVPGMAELSGVSAWADCRGRGLARALIGHVMREMMGRGETPFLHSYADNAGAIALYETLGFRIRRAVHMLALAR
ncbi:putative GNAT family acetyltransferase [Sphingopyxis panaciterrae]|uniref:GNAT family N-acetyltransferase n=1 Tax=Sphingopyxis panaciterrae TaxID=363841 RepID=UPI00141E67A3|nr:GNAT family N-acetyltransferase [Sphingopyxis panaciterrae]NIJ38016.1 putative GNAT family acetyltransferase [Sphingopyxis panaciterrae]